MELIDGKVKLFHHKWVLFDLFYQIVKQQRLHKELVNENVVMDFIEMYTKLAEDKKPRYSYDETITEDTPTSTDNKNGDAYNLLIANAELIAAEAYHRMILEFPDFNFVPISVKLDDTNSTTDGFNSLTFTCGSDSTGTRWVIIPRLTNNVN